MREQNEDSDILRRYRLDFPHPIPSLEVEYDPGSSDYTHFPDSPVIGLGADPQWLFIARRHNTDVVVERIDPLTGQPDDWTTELKDIPVATNGTGLFRRGNITSYPAIVFGSLLAPEAA